MPNSKNNALCYFRLFNARPTKDAFDVYLDDEQIYNYLLYEDFTKYYPISSGKHVIKITYHHQHESLYEKKINLQRYQLYTGVLGHKYMEPETFHIFCLEESKKKLEGTHLALRLLHFSRFEGNLNLSIDDTPLPIKNIRYGQASSYLVQEPNTYTLHIGSTPETFTDEVELPPPLASCAGQKLKPGRLYSIFFVGEGTVSFPYKPILSIDGYSYLKLDFEQKSTI
ncbi:MAG: DUF4397 domain-containing protein [Niameybacter sp.]|uniref:DUF4397 domain-containing protein n=1 Tax=Niameybacter sp. TaxID=2033640 RepID=UPI002FC7BF1B